MIPQAFVTSASGAIRFTPKLQSLDKCTESQKMAVEIPDFKFTHPPGPVTDFLRDDDTLLTIFIVKSVKVGFDEEREPAGIQNTASISEPLRETNVGDGAILGECAPHTRVNRWGPIGETNFEP